MFHGEIDYVSVALEEDGFQRILAFQVRILRQGASSIVPLNRLRPWCMIKSSVQSSSTSDNKWELTITAASASAARSRIESLSVRMPRGSSPVSGSSNSTAAGRCR